MKPPPHKQKAYQPTRATIDAECAAIRAGWDRHRWRQQRADLVPEEYRDDSLEVREVRYTESDKSLGFD